MTAISIAAFVVFYTIMTAIYISKKWRRQNVPFLFHVVYAAGCFGLGILIGYNLPDGFFSGLF